MTLIGADQQEAASAESVTDSWIALCYHDVQLEMPRTGGGPDRFTVPLASFECMLDAIAEQGRMGCSLAVALAMSGRRRVAITFDDGTRGQYDHAFPALVARGMTATFYVTTDWVGRPGFMNWRQIRDLVSAGMSVQSHTRTHPFLSELGADALRAELGTSKQILDAELGQQTLEIAFPGGDPPARRLRHIIAESGYATAVGTLWGVNQDREVDRVRNFVRRCTARGEITPAMARRVAAYDPWLNVNWRMKEAALRRIRGTLGASRYSRWRRVLLDSLAGKPGR